VKTAERLAERAAAIGAAGVSHTYHTDRGDIPALCDVSAGIAPGEFCALIGPSGCGKTTLLHILAGLLRPSRGSVVLPPAAPGRLPAAVVFQGICTFPWMTVLDNVEYGLRMLGVPRGERRARAEAELRRVGLSSFRHAYPRQLSEGMRQRVSIARAFATDPAVLLMDEPFASLDEQTRLVLQDELLRLWHERRPTVLFVTHSLDEAARLADRVLVMSARPGRITADLPVPFSRPRGYRDVRRDPAYGEFTARLWDALENEIANTADGAAEGLRA
jgi:NitT/TauT family transport system ATP-binding protein